MNSLLIALRRLGNLISFRGRITFAQSLFRRAFRFTRARIEIKDFDNNLTINLRLSEHMQRRIFWMGYYNMQIVSLLKKILNEKMVFIDIGANIGEISLVAAKYIGPKGKVIAFEPVNSIAYELQRNLEKNNYTHATVITKGVSDRCCAHIPIYAGVDQKSAKEENLGLGSLYTRFPEDPPAQYIEITTLDAFLKESPVSRIDIIKIDIEGAELPCLKGSEKTISHFNPLIIIEVQDASTSIAGYTSRDIFDYLSTFGYVFYKIVERGKLKPISFADLQQFQNVMCIPKNKAAQFRGLFK